MFGEFCCCCCFPLLPGLACSIHATWGPSFWWALWIIKNTTPNHWGQICSKGVVWVVQDLTSYPVFSVLPTTKARNALPVSEPAIKMSPLCFSLWSTATPSLVIGAVILDENCTPHRANLILTRSLWWCRVSLRCRRYAHFPIPIKGVKPHSNKRDS